MNRAKRIFNKWRMSAASLQIILIAMALGFLSLCAVAEPPNSKGDWMTGALTEADNGKTVDLRVGDEVVLRLPENASTGYRWTVDAADGNLVDVKEGKYLAASNALGSGGEAQWIVHAKAAGATEIKLKCWHSWEGERSVIERFEFTLRIAPRNQSGI
jgi:inhibitor of cysteine peptidase